MPLYDFINMETGEQFSKILKISDREIYLADNPHIQQQILAAPTMVRGSSSTFKNDDGWKDNLKRIAAAHPNSALAENVGGRDSKKVKVKEIAQKHGFAKTQSHGDGL
jgi:hypothetical protein